MSEKFRKEKCDGCVEPVYHKIDSLFEKRTRMIETALADKPDELAAVLAANSHDAKSLKSLAFSVLKLLPYKNITADAEAVAFLINEARQDLEQITRNQSIEKGDAAEIQRHYDAKRADSKLAIECIADTLGIGTQYQLAAKSLDTPSAGASATHGF